MSETMKLYIGTKVLKAAPMTRGEYNAYRGWTIPHDENPADEGFVTDNGAGHIQWQPKDVFEDGFSPFNGMDFGMAIAALKKGMKIARTGWNGKGMWLQMVAADSWFISSDAIDDDSFSLRKLPWIGMKTADVCFVPWLASQTDVLAEDWQIVE